MDRFEKQFSIQFTVGLTDTYVVCFYLNICIASYLHLKRLLDSQLLDVFLIQSIETV